ncbi:hypothetical protein KEM48_011375 [Puccinia striiformis f. sp. tritici PST-130]|nr:hypothetical protein KEM48_011375 [Puccinia striiformis f. sp. tritici PST-130]
MVCLRQPIPSLALLRFRPPLVFSTLWSTTAITFTVSKLNSSIDLWPTKLRSLANNLSTTLGHQPKPVKIEEIPTKIINIWTRPHKKHR